jgi:ribosomal protein L7Ae-like RNA K-turn-binding protein
MIKEAAQLIGLMGLSAKARQTVTGSESCIAFIRSGRASLVLIDESMSANGRKRYVDSCQTHRVKLAFVSPGLIEKALGKEGRLAVAFKANGLSDKLILLSGAGIPDNGCIPLAKLTWRNNAGVQAKV